MPSMGTPSAAAAPPRNERGLWERPEAVGSVQDYGTAQIRGDLYAHPWGRGHPRQAGPSRAPSAAVGTCRVVSSTKPNGSQRGRDSRILGLGVSTSSCPQSFGDGGEEGAQGMLWGW